MDSIHAVLMLVYNTTPAQCEITKHAIESVLAQDIGPLTFWIADNGSTDESTATYLENLRSKAVYVQSYSENKSPLAIANDMALVLFGLGYDKILGTPNDVILPPNAYRLMNQWPRGFICASQTDRQDFPILGTASAVSENTPMAVMLTRRWAYDAVVAKDGYFLDEGFFHYASDCDLALRMAACGIRGIQLDLQYYHFGSASWRLAAGNLGKEMTSQADRDREYFERKWGFKVNSLEYGQLAGQGINWRGVPNECILK